MEFEVEQKFPVTDPVAIESQLRQMGGAFHAAVQQSDRYYAHPVRDFAASDEALRIRNVGQQWVITYKGPKVDQQTKTRREIELPVSDGRQAAALLEALGFRPVAEVRKWRRPVDITWQGQVIQVALDQVEGLGHFVELELMADEADLDAARSKLAGLAAALGLTGSQRRSYLELLLARQTDSNHPP